MAPKAEVRGSLVVGRGVDDEINLGVIETVIGAGTAKGMCRVRLDPADNGVGSRGVLQMEYDGRGSVAAEFGGILDESRCQLRQGQFEG